MPLGSHSGTLMGLAALISVLTAGPVKPEAWIFYILTTHVMTGGDVKMEIEQSRQYPTETACVAARFRVEQAYPGATLDCRNIAPAKTRD